MDARTLITIPALLARLAIAALVGTHLRLLAAVAATFAPAADGHLIRINFINPNDPKPWPNPPGWIAYDGSVYTKARGYGWTSPLTGFYAGGGGEDQYLRFPAGEIKSPRDGGRLELATWQGTHRENQPLVFRIDLPNGWYRVHCASAGFGELPVVDQRNFGCRAQDAVFAGSQFGPPLKASGRDVVEGSNIVEVTQGSLRIVVGDPAYGGWTWSHTGAWYSGWTHWWGRLGAHRYAESWHQKLTRLIDPGFHHLRINSLAVEQVAAPTQRHVPVFRDFFNRDDSRDVNSGIAGSDRWSTVKLDSAAVEPIATELYKTSLKLTGPKRGKGLLGVIQKKLSPEAGIIRYAARVSLFTGEGSKIHSGFQEAGLLILGDPNGTNEFNSTFVGVALDGARGSAPGSVRYRIGNGQAGYQSNLEVSDASLPFQVTEGEHEIVIDHDVKGNLLRRIEVNGKDITGFFSLNHRKQRTPRGVFGIRAAMDSLHSGVRLQQFYWYYKVENTAKASW